MSHEPKPKPNDPNPELKPRLNEEQTIAYFNAKNIRHLLTSQIRAGEPFLFVIYDLDCKHYPGQPYESNIARVSTPIEVSATSVTDYVDVTGRVDYYAIDAATGEPKWVGKSERVVKKPFLIKDENLFVAHDGLFPVGPK